MIDRIRFVFWIGIPATIVLLTACAAVSRVGRMERRRISGLPRVAVLKFEHSGFMGGESMEQYASDVLTSQLFIEKRACPVDRSIVRFHEAESGVRSALLHQQDLAALAQKLEVDYLLIGKTVGMNDTMVDSIEDERIFLKTVIRILDARSGDVVGMVSGEAIVKKSIRNAIDRILGKMTDRIRI